jgi:hypothetical protein
MVFVILGEPAVPIEPPECSFHNPASWKHLESFDGIGSLDDFKRPPILLFHVLDEFPGIPTIRPDELELLEVFPGSFKDESGSVAILDIRFMDYGSKKESESVDQNMAFPAFYLFTGVIATKPPFSVVFTLCESMMPAVGCSFFFAFLRTFPRKTSCRAFHVPFFLHFLK